MGSPYSTSELHVTGEWKFIRPRDIKSDGNLETVTFVSNDFAKKNKKSSLEKGDILLQNIFSFGKMAITKEKDLPAIASQNLFIIRSKVVAPEVLFEYLKSKAVAEAFCKQLEDLARGSTIRHIGLRDVGEIPVPLPFSNDLLVKFSRSKPITRHSGS